MSIQMINQAATVHRGLIVDPQGKHYRKMRQAIWLYLYLLLAVNRSSGRRLLSPALIARQMGLKEQTIRSWLGHLRKASYLALDQQGSNYCVTVKKWRQANDTAKNRPKSGDSAEGQDSTLLDPEELAQALGEAPNDPFWKQVVLEHDPLVVKDTLEKVVKVPANRIKKSRAALFRYLINKRSKT